MRLGLAINRCDFSFVSCGFSITDLRVTDLGL